MSDIPTWKMYNFGRNASSDRIWEQTGLGI